MLIKNYKILEIFVFRRFKNDGTNKNCTDHWFRN